MSSTTLLKSNNTTLKTSSQFEFSSCSVSKLSTDKQNTLPMFVDAVSRVQKYILIILGK